MPHPERVAELELKIDVNTKWEDVLDQIEGVEKPGFNHFDQWPEDEALIREYFEIRQDNLRDKDVMEEQTVWMTEADQIEGFWLRREEFVIFITQATESPGVRERAKRYREGLKK